MKKPSRKNRPAKSRRKPRAGMRNVSELQLYAIPGMPEIRKGDDLAERIVGAGKKAGLRFEEGDIVGVAQKIVSKAEGAVDSCCYGWSQSLSASSFCMALARNGTG